MVGVRDVAAAAGVSVGTVSHVLNHPERVAAETVTRVKKVIAELGFVRNDAARQLREGRSRTIGLVVLDARNPFFMDVARGAEEAAEEHGLSVLIANSDDDAAREAAHLDLFEQQRVFGVLVTPASGDASRVQQLVDRGIPVVLVDRTPEEARMPAVAVDDVLGGRMAAEHLLRTGRRRLAFVGGPLSLRQVADRLEGARQAVATHADATIEVLPPGSLTVTAGREVGRQLSARAPGDRPDAVFAANDLTAFGILQAVSMSGDVRIPDDMALIGYDDIDFAAASVVPLSSIRQPAALIGRRAVELLVSPVSGDEGQVRFQPELIERQSTRRPV